MITTKFTYPPIKTVLADHKDNEYTLSIYPLTPGFGYTLGNSIRRILLSSIPGFAVTKVRINDLTHEYQVIKGVKEDALDVLLNLKSLRAKIVSDAESVVIKLSTKEGGVITAKSFDKNSEVEIVNKDQHICTLSEGAKLDIEVEISRGYGYVMYEKRDLRGNTDPTGLLIDALFTPVRNVSLDVEQTRVGDRTDYDRVNIAFETDGTVDGQSIVEYALKLAVDMFNNIHSSFLAGEDVQKVEKKVLKAEAASTSDVIDLPARITKILEKNDISTNKALKARVDEIQDLPGLGDKAIEQIEEYIKNL
jgi:DNA-directed RNA polymerase subunit alpha